jgi:hypothetical protein
MDLSVRSLWNLYSLGKFAGQFRAVSGLPKNEADLAVSAEAACTNKPRGRIEHDG